MAILLFAIAAALLALAVIAVLLVSVASRMEDSAWTLAGPAPGPLQAIARRIVGFHAEGIEWLHNRLRPRLGGPPARVSRARAAVVPGLCHGAGTVPP
jgi:hypothetical protein